MGDTLLYNGDRQGQREGLAPLGGCLGRSFLPVGLAGGSGESEKLGLGYRVSGNVGLKLRVKTSAV
jgi:hypothetical protein